MPVIEIVGHLADGVADMPPGKYVIAEVEQLEGDINDLLLEGMATTKKILTYEDGKLIIEVVGLRDADTVTWSGANGNSWD
mgnify:FL=1